MTDHPPDPFDVHMAALLDGTIKALEQASVPDREREEAMDTLMTTIGRPQPSPARRLWETPIPELWIIGGNLVLRPLTEPLSGIPDLPAEHEALAPAANSEELCFAYETEQEETTEERLCPICMDPIETDLPHVKFSCGHRSHRGCIKEWLSQNAKCPLCRIDVQIN